MFIPVTVGTATVFVSATKGVIPTMYNATNRAVSKEVIAAFIVAEAYRKDSDKLERLVKRAKIINKVEHAFEHGKTTHLCLSDKGLMGLRSEYHRALRDYVVSSPIILAEYDGRYANECDVMYLTQTLINGIVEGRLKLN